MRATGSMLIVGAIVIGLGGCGTVRTHGLPGGSALTTGAEVRAISESEVGASSVHGRVQPKYIRCAEPSPDVAKAVSNSFGGSLSAMVSGLPAGVTPQVAGAISRSHAEAMAQLTERLATMQLLRDGLYRACEAYANGAISDTTYAVMLSRYDKTMVTMLLGELAAGAFGRSLSGAGTATESRAAASLEFADKQMRSREAERVLKTTQDRHTSDERALRRAEQEALTSPDDASRGQRVKDLKQTSDQSQKDVEKAERDLHDALKAETASAAKALEVNTVGGITASHDPEIARALTDLARKYIENLNFDAIEVACLSALDRPGEASGTPFASYCTTGLLKELQASKGQLLKALIDRATEERKRAAGVAALHGSMKEMQDAIRALQTLGVQIDELRQPGHAPTTAPVSVAPASTAPANAAPANTGASASVSPASEPPTTR
jgi:hypothetical protein